METLEVFKWVERLYAGKLDKGGQPYLNHLVRVMLRCGTGSGIKEELAQAALLHDTIEDGLLTAEDMLRAGVAPTVVHAVVILTRLNGEDYKAYIRRILQEAQKGKFIPKYVKVADLKDNLDPDRPYKNTDSAVTRYRDALAALGSNWK